MEYNGKLYGKIGRKTFDTGKTSKDWDKAVDSVKKLSKALKSLQMSMKAHPDFVCNEYGEFEDMVNLAEDVLNETK